MKALIIAAGKGSRFKNLTVSEPKSLIPLLGTSLIERVMLSAKEAGINEFVVVIGYLGEKIKHQLGNGNSNGINIEYVENEEWEKANGISVLKGKSSLKENFVLLMADHMFDARILQGLVKRNLKGSVILAVERKEPMSDDTKVLERDGKIIEIGKKIEESNCVDTGIFLCSPKIFTYLEDSTKEGRFELSHGIAKAAKNGDAEVFDIGEIKKDKKPLWMDIDTEEELRKAEKIYNPTQSV